MAEQQQWRETSNGAPAQPVRRKSGNTMTNHSAAAAATLTPSAMHASCLVVEDNQVLQQIMAQWLRKLDLVVTQAFNGEQAISLCEKQKFDVIFMDLSLPLGNGIEATCAIRCSPLSLNQSTPVIACTSYAVNTDLVAAGFNDLISKPFTRDMLLCKVNDWARQHVTSTLSFAHPAREPVPLMGLEAGQSIDIYTELPNIFETLQEVMGSDLLSATFGSNPQDLLIDNMVPVIPERRIPSVLVVEDDNVTQRVVSTYLRKTGATVTQAFDGAQAVLLCNNNSYDVILMDISLPNVNGHEATRLIRTTSPLNQTTPIIAFSSYANANDFTKSGMNDFLAKPFTKMDLTGIVEKWMPFSPQAHSPNGQTLSPKMQVSRPPSGEPHMFNAFGTPLLQEDAKPIQSKSPNGSVGQLPRTLSNTTSRNGLSPPVVMSSSAELDNDDEAKYIPSKKQRQQKPSLDEEPKDTSRVVHNDKERIRRKEISGAVDEFRKLVPGCNDKIDKANVLKMAVEYMKQLIQAQGLSTNEEDCSPCAE